ncbi:MAG: hypothetical protein IPF93_07115 [Saprospiraceae bacterium]|nr:hypothetical protein [Saprospiraceae bacterium]
MPTALPFYSSTGDGNTGAYNFRTDSCDYVVGVTPPAGYKSSAVDGGDPTTIHSMTTTEQDQAPRSKSLPITLTSGGEPTNDGDGNNGNLTVDFGFAGTALWRPGVERQ